MGERIRKSNPKIAKKYFPREREKIDSVKSESGFGRNNFVLQDAFTAWSGLEEMRKRGERNEMYTFGDQWGDRIWDGCKWVTERKSIQEQGNIPLQNNRIRGIVRSVIGVFQSTQTEPVAVSRDRDEQGKGDVMSSTIQYVYQLNKLWGLDSSNLSYFLISGMAAFRSTYGWRNNKMDVWNDIVNYNNIFFDNHMQDPRHWDCHLIGEIHDASLYDVMAQFSDGSRRKAEYIRSIYGDKDRERTITYLESNLTDDIRMHLDFFIPKDETLCRVIEVWKKESKERLLVHDWLTGDYYKVETNEESSLVAENNRRIEHQMAAGVLPEDMKLIEYQWFIDNYWYYYYLSPFGDILKEGETPFWHESHPYSFKIYPFYNSKIYPFVSDFIDQQRYINRLIMLQDFVTRSSAKGVLAIHEDSIPKGTKIQDIADQWAVFNGVIVYTGKAGVQAPQQIVSSTSQLGVTDMLGIQLKLLEDISGVQGALQGKAPNAGTPASLYMQQTQNAQTSLTELFEAYRELREERDIKNMKLIQQFYTEPRYINITGKNTRPESIMYDPNTVRNTDFDLSISESQSTPAYRLVMNEFLMQLFGAGQITLTELLENGAFPFADKLLQAVNSRQQEAANAQNGMPSGGQQQAIAPESVNQYMQQHTNPLIQQMLYGNKN